MYFLLKIICWTKIMQQLAPVLDLKDISKEIFLLFSHVNKKLASLPDAPIFVILIFNLGQSFQKQAFKYESCAFWISTYPPLTFTKSTNFLFWKAKPNFLPKVIMSSTLQGHKNSYTAFHLLYAHRFPKLFIT